MRGCIFANPLNTLVQQHHAATSSLFSQRYASKLTMESYLPKLLDDNGTSCINWHLLQQSYSSIRFEQNRQSYPSFAEKQMFRQIANGT